METVVLTIEGKSIALAHSCRELFLFIGIVESPSKVVGMPTHDMTIMHVTIHEDNTGALVLAGAIPPQFTPRSKYYAINMVWFHKKV